MTDEQTIEQKGADRIALVLTEYGLQRMSARVLAAFLVTERATLTQGDIVEELGAGSGSVSTAISAMLGVGLLERVPGARGRREHYRVRDGAWPRLFSKQNSAIEATLVAVRETIAELPADSRARGRLEEIRDFQEFLLAELPALIDRWQAGRSTS